MPPALSVEAARTLADEVLFATANEIDAMPVLPRERLDLLAEQGWYGLSAPPSGMKMEDAYPVLEAFAPMAPGVFLYHPGKRQILPKLRAFIDHVKGKA